MNSVSEKKSRGHRTSKIVRSNQSYSNGYLPYHCSFQYLAGALDACRGMWIWVRSRYAQKQLARTFLSDQPGTFESARARCKTCPFIRNVEKISGPKRSAKITDHSICTLANVIYCTPLTLCKKLYVGETGIRLGDPFRKQVNSATQRRQKRNNVAKPWNKNSFSKQALLILTISTSAFHSTNLFCCLSRQQPSFCI